MRHHFPRRRVEKHGQEYFRIDLDFVLTWPVVSVSVFFSFPPCFCWVFFFYSLTGRGETLHNLLPYQAPLPPPHIFTSEHVLLLQGLSPRDYCHGCRREHLLSLCYTLFLGIVSKSWLQNPSRLWVSKRRIFPHLDPSSGTLWGCGVQHYRPTSSP